MGDPVGCFGDEFGRIPLVTGDPICLPEPGEVLAAAELPGHFHVGRTVELAVVDVGAVLDRPLTARLEVGVPR